VRTLALLGPAVGLVLSLAGCGRGPTLVAGKPVAHWLAALGDPDAKVRRKAALKLGNFGPARREVLPALLGALRDRDASVRCEVIRALVKFGTEARPAVPALEEIHQHDGSASVRACAAAALDRFREE
jgi:HEAT repeat protein